MRKNRNISFHLFILIFLSLLTIFLFFKFSTEDSYITYRYAKNLVNGKGFVYNQSEKFLGTTAPFYGLLLAFFGFLGFNIPTIGGLLSTFSLGLTAILIYLLTLRKGYPLVGLLSGLFILLNPWFLITFGSETFFQLLMVVSAFYFYDQKKYTPAVIFCALAFLVRADGIIPVAVISIDYIIKNKKIPLKQGILFVILCAPLFLFYHFSFNSFLPATLEAKQAQYASGLWRGFLPGILNFMGLLLKKNNLLLSFAPLLIIGGVAILLLGRIWYLFILWAMLHTLGYTFLKVSFYHWYPVPLIFLLMMTCAFSLHFIKSTPHALEKHRIKNWNVKIFKREIKMSTKKFRVLGPFLKWGHRILWIAILGFTAIALVGGTKSYYDEYTILPFPKLELYTQAGKWAAANTEPDSSIAFIEVGYFGYYAQRKIIDLAGLITPRVSSHIREGDFQWAVKRYKPDYFIYNEEFSGWLKQIIDQPWFEESYQQIKKMNHPGYRFTLTIFKKVADFEVPPILTLDSHQQESNFAVGEITKGVEIGQTFYCSRSNLARIEVALATYNRLNHQEVIFHLKKSPRDKKDIYTKKFKASNVIDNEYRSFDFPPLPDSKGKMFYFSFESPLSKRGDAITAWASSENKYKKGTLYLNGKKSKGDLRFKIYCYKN